MEYLYINNQNSVAVIYNPEGIVEDVYINRKKHDFKDEKNPNKEAYAQETKRKFYNNFLNNQFENILILTGAGSSIGIGKGDKKGKILSQLWDDSEKELGKENFELLCKLVKYNDTDSNGIIKNFNTVLNKNY